MKKKIIAGASALAVALSAVGIANMGTVKVSAFDGDFDSGVYDTWDGNTYDFSWYDGASTDYTISSAAQLASLSILTNDLSGEDYAEFVAALPDTCTPYISTVDMFDGCTITIAADIDMRDYDFLPIAYPFDTPNITNEDYDALGHVPDNLTAVDSWVGDSSGNMINTRYLEYPESEMRFRDLLYGVNFDEAVNARYIYDWGKSYDDTVGTLSDGTPVLARTTALPVRLSNGMFIYDKSDCNGMPHEYYVGGTFIIPHPVSDTDVVLDEDTSAIRELKSTDIIASYTFDDVSQYADVTGFMGTIDGDGYRIKGLHPTTPWLEDEEPTQTTTLSDETEGTTEGTEGSTTVEGTPGAEGTNTEGTESTEGTNTGEGTETNESNVPSAQNNEDKKTRLNTYDPIGKGLVGYLGTDGVIYDLNVKGTYTSEDVVSYSAFLCAYNYGTIENCYVHGEMEQGLVEMLYPVARDYGANGTSTYKLSDEIGTVLPVGNSGFLTAWNEGTIIGCTTAGAVTQAYRQFGFMTCTNKGTIENSLNKAYFSTTEVETDFTTDEWSYDYSGMTTTWYEPLTELDYETVMLTALNSDYYTDKGNVSFSQHTPYEYLRIEDIEGFQGWIPGAPAGPYPYDCFGLSSLRGMAANLQGLTEDAKAWIPVQYETETGESVAANHLYGVYGYTAVGGICVVNDGTISGCTNEGDITVMHNTSTRVSGTLTNDADVDSALNYIRPDNAYGLFSTQSNTVNNAAGIAVLNRGVITAYEDDLGELTVTKNKGSVVERAFTERDKVKDGLTPFGQITYTTNGFYANDCIIYGAPELTYNPTGLRWHIEAETYNETWTYVRHPNIIVYDEDVSWEDTETTETYLPLDENMPYPTTYYAFQQSENELTGYSVTSEGIARQVDEDIISEYPYTTIQLTSGITVWNTNKIENTANEGTAENGITHFSTGIEDVNAVISNCVQNGAVTNNIGYYLYNTNAYDTIVTNDKGTYGLAYIVRAEESPVEQKNLNVYAGSGAYYKLYADDNRMIVEDVRLYDNILTGKGISTYALNTDFNRVYNFQTSTNGLAVLDNCNVTNFYMFNNAVENGIGEGTLESTMDTVAFYGNSAEYAMGTFENGAIANVSVNTGNSADTTLGMCDYVLNYKNGSLTNAVIFTDLRNNTLDCYNVDITDVMLVGTFEEKAGRADYLNKLMACDCKNLWIEVEPPVIWKDPRFNAEQYLPGVLYNEEGMYANTFDNCVIQMDDGYDTLPRANFVYDLEITVPEGVIAVPNRNGKATGEMAYMLDRGDTDSRTHEYTVAFTDTVDVLSAIAENIETDKVFTDSVRPLVPYTRKTADITEDTFYRVDIPYTAHGLGEVKGTVIYNELEQSTLATDQVFPQTYLFLPKGAEYTVTPMTEKGYGLAKLEEIIDERSTELKFVINEPLTLTMPDNDVTIYATWANICVIEVDEDNELVEITTDVTSSAPNKTISVSVDLKDSTTAVAKVWYYNYVVNESNREVLDTENPVEIDKQTMTFVMPANNIKIFASVWSKDVKATEFVLGGVKGTIDNDTNIITVQLDSSMDLTSIAPDKFELSGIGMTEGVPNITPAITEKIDFTKDVVYTAIAETGDVEIYTVKVIALEDGLITAFDVLGKSAEIDQENGKIKLTISSDIDLIAVTPKIAWSGTKITPVGAVDLSDLTETYTVTDSKGVDKAYTVEVTIPTDDTALQKFVVDIPTLPDADWVVDESTMTIRVLVPYGTDVSACPVTDFEWYGMATNLTVGDILNLTKCNYLTIKADNGETKTYSILALESPSTRKQIHQFVIYGYEGAIDETNKTITVTIPAKYDIRNIAPDVVTFTAKGVADAYVRQNFTVPVEYVVTAYDGTTVTYTVTVVQE